MNELSVPGAQQIAACALLHPDWLPEDFFLHFEYLGYSRAVVACEAGMAIGAAVEENRRRAAR